MIKLRACRNCKNVTEELKCEKCGGDTVLEWKGYIFILDPNKSLIAKRTGITVPGEYAIKVR
ncbi:MAG: DNA-directed RNA polymerase subunit E'' [Candidatus Thermoplasmatota archaeon]|jgi:DNA-directed RNA polymerase, subunit E'''' (EC 2.7.7.6)|nr:DNA-directed RNA polymerase subunit E'' [Candidatus Thermoplasmatota archaeon]